MKLVVITLPSLADPGGVTEYYNTILPVLYESDKLNIYPLEIGRTHGRGKRFYHITDQIRFLKFLLTMKPDLVHINPSLNFKSFVRDGIFIYWARLCNIPVVVFFHGWDIQFEGKLKKQFKFFFDSTYKKAGAFIVLASVFKNALKTLGVPAQVHLLTTTLNPCLMKNFSIEKKIIRMKQSGSVKLLFLSRIEREKGVFETVDAFSMLLEEHPTLKLSIAGNGGALQALKKYISGLGLSNRIALLGDIRGNRKKELLASHDLYCMPTYHPEGMPLSVIEAMASGMPLITRPVGGITDFFQEGKMGYLCRSIAPEEVAACIRKLLLNKEAMYTMAEYNHHYATHHFAAGKVALKIQKIYLKMLRI